MYCELMCCVLLKYNVILCNAAVPRALCDRCNAVGWKNAGIRESVYNLVLISSKAAAETLGREIVKAAFRDDAVSKSQNL